MFFVVFISICSFFVICGVNFTTGGLYDDTLFTFIARCNRNYRQHSSTNAKVQNDIAHEKTAQFSDERLQFADQTSARQTLKNQPRHAGVLPAVRPVRFLDTLSSLSAGGTALDANGDPALTTKPTTIPPAN